MIRFLLPAALLTACVPVTPPARQVKDALASDASGSPNVGHIDARTLAAVRGRETAVGYGGEIVRYEGRSGDHLCFSIATRADFKVGEDHEGRMRAHWRERIELPSWALQARANFDDLPANGPVEPASVPRNFDSFEYAPTGERVHRDQRTMTATGKAIFCAPTPAIDANTRYLTLIKFSDSNAFFSIWLLDGASPAEPATTPSKPATEGVQEATNRVLGSGASPGRDERVLATILANEPTIERFARLLQQSGMMERLRGGEPFTVIAPVNEEIENIPAKMRKDLEADPEKLRAFVGRFLVPGSFPSASLGDNESKPTLVPGASVRLRKKKGGVLEIAGDPVQREIPATNGVLYILGHR